jgi:glutaredoxin-like protein
MALIKDKDRAQIEKKFAQLVSPVKLLMFTQDFECEYCAVTRELLEDLAVVSNQLTLEVKDFAADAEAAARYGVDKIPAIVVMGEKDYGIRFFGVPAGYEFSTLLDGIVDVSRKDPQLSPEVLDLLAKVDQPVQMQVMVTPT